MAGVFLGTYLGTYLGSRVVGTPGSGSFSPLDLSPVAWWDGTDASTMNTASDGSGSVPGTGNDVARWVDKANSIAITQDGASGVPSWDGSALTFDRSAGEYLKDSRAASNWAFMVEDGGAHTIYLRARRNTTDTGNMFPVSLFGGSSPYSEVQLIDSGNVLRAVFASGGTDTISAGAYTDDATFDAAFIVTQDAVGANYRAFLDGSFSDQGAPQAGSGFDPSSSLTIGARGTGADSLEGAIEQVLVFDRRLSDSEVTQIYDHFNPA